jgi:hypothetical protein
VVLKLFFWDFLNKFQNIGTSWGQGPSRGNGKKLYFFFFHVQYCFIDNFIKTTFNTHLSFIKKKFQSNIFLVYCLCFTLCSNFLQFWWQKLKFMNYRAIWRWSVSWRIWQVNYVQISCTIHLFNKVFWKYLKLPIVVFLIGLYLKMIFQFMTQVWMGEIYGSIFGKAKL